MNKINLPIACALIAVFTPLAASAKIYTMTELRKMNNAQLTSEYRANAQYLQEDCGFFGYQRLEGQTRGQAIGKALSSPFKKAGGLAHSVVTDVRRQVRAPLAAITAENDKEAKAVVDDHFKQSPLSNTFRSIGRILISPGKCLKARADNRTIRDEASQRGLKITVSAANRDVATDTRRASNDSPKATGKAARVGGKATEKPTGNAPRSPFKRKSVSDAVADAETL